MDRLNDGFGPGRIPQRRTETGLLEPLKEATERHPWATLRLASFCFAWRGLPAGRIRYSLEMRTGDKWLEQILRVGDNCGYYKPFITVGFRKTVEILLQNCLFAKRNTIFAQVSRAYMPG